jgi:tRNA pseudouridine38-40 synthase
MREAAAHLVGEHDFRSFCVSGSAEGKRTIRRVVSIDIGEEEHLGERCVVVKVIGNAFLHSMVRVIVGTLVEVGVGRRESAWAKEALIAQDRRAAGPTAPAQGLTLWSVGYRDEVWL